jgi:zinc/manganese transport system permease protein
VSLGVAFYSVYPVGFFVTTIGFTLYVLAAGGRAVATRLGTRPPRMAHGSDGARLAGSAVRA